MASVISVESNPSGQADNDLRDAQLDKARAIVSANPQAPAAALVEMICTGSPRVSHDEGWNLLHRVAGELNVVIDLR